ncbi:MAG TPA: 2-dehydropantoate 2-reductase [Myxococcota bacterium]|nr:2-dehydropantoate 2-reductase [Myxococcota bacterium]HND29297.1 2-dehydropantoate 2-reductase [Myxococcota bacterium]
MRAKVLVVGCGGIGGICAAHLAETGQDVVAFSSNSAIAAHVSTHGYRLLGEDPRVIPGRVVDQIPAGPFDYILLATQPPQVEEAARSVVGSLAPGGAMLCLQNGLCEARVAAIAGADRCLGAVVGWGASMPEPGVYERTAAGGFTLGHPQGKSDPRLAELAGILEPIGPCEITDNLPGKRWSKLALNSAISSLGCIGGDRLGVLMQLRPVRRLALEIMTEVVEVAKAEGVRLEKVSGTLDLEWIALTPEERQSSGSASLVAKHSLLLAVGFRYRRMRSSMLAAVERGRPPAVDFLNGEVVSRGIKHGIPTPINAAIQEKVWEIARGKDSSGVATLERLHAATRSRPSP